MNTEDSEFQRLEHEALLRASQPEQPSKAGELSDDDCRDIYNAAMYLPNQNIVSVMRYIIAHIVAQPVQPAEDTMEIVGYQYQWTNPAENPDPENLPIEWQTVIPARGQTTQSKLDKLRKHRHSGKFVYRVRALYAPKETV